MEEENDNLEMSLFNSDEPLELNLGESFEDLDETDDISLEDALEGSEETNEEENNNLSEDENSETVAEEEDSEEEGNGDDTQDDSPNLYSSFASVLNEQGLLPSLDLQDRKIETVDDLTVAFKEELNNQVKTYLVNKVGEEGYEALEKGITLGEYQQYERNISDIDSITDDMIQSDLDLAKEIIKQDYIDQGLSEDRALRLLKKTIDLGEEAIVEEAKESLPSLKKMQEIKLQKIQEERAAQREKDIQLQEKVDNDLKNSIYNADEFIPGVKATKAFKDKVYNSITKIVGKSPEGIPENKLMRARRENPIDFDSKLYALYELTDGFKKTANITKNLKSKAISDLEKTLRSTKFDNSSAPAYLTDSESYNGLGDELVVD